MPTNLERTARHTVKNAANATESDILLKSAAVRVTTRTARRHRLVEAVEDVGADVDADMDAEEVADTTIAELQRSATKKITQKTLMMNSFREQ